MTTLTVWIDGVGLLGPNLASWASAREVMSGAQAHVGSPTVLPPPARLPPAERRRAGAAVKLALAIEHGLMPAGLNVQQRDPALHLNYLLANRAAPVRRVLSNSFGFGGSNASLVLGAPR